VGGPEHAARLTPQTYTRALVEQVDAHYRAAGVAAPRIAIEPGRALTGNTQALAARVLTTRDTADGFTYAVLDAGINIAGILGHELHQVYRVPFPEESGRSARPTKLYRLVGPICQPGDVIFYCVRLPELAAGDVLMIMDSGAYFEPDSTSFSFRRPATIALNGEQTQTIRRAESFEDMIHRDTY
jgi:diaminopimelate decarboxylase